MKGIMKDFISKLRANMKAIITSAVVLVVLVIVGLLVFKDFELVSGGNNSKDPLPQSVSCDEKVAIREDIMLNKNRSQNDIKSYIDSIATGCIKKEQFWLIQGFLTEIYLKYPGKVNKWLRKKDINSIERVQALIIPLNSTQNRKKYEKYIKKNVRNQIQLDRYMGYNSIDIDKFMVENPGYIEYLWGRYFSFGDTKYLDKIIRCTEADYPEDCFMNVETQDLAKATLRQYSQNDSEIKNYLVSSLPAYREKTQKVMRLEVLGMKDSPSGVEESVGMGEPLQTAQPVKKKWFKWF
jgi:hypothetical protein